MTVEQSTAVSLPSFLDADDSGHSSWWSGPRIALVVIGALIVVVIGVAVFNNMSSKVPAASVVSVSPPATPPKLRTSGPPQPPSPPESPHLSLDSAGTPPVLAPAIGQERPIASPSDDDLVAYYPFNGTPQDFSRYQNQGIAVGQFVYSSTAVKGRSAAIDNSTYVAVPDNPSLRLERFTLAAWVGAARLQEGNRILEKGNSKSYYLYLNRLGHPVVGFFDGRSYHDLVGPASVSPSRFAFVVGTFDGSFLRLYVDKTSVGEQAIAGQPNQTVEPLFIGWKYNGIPEDHFVGFIDEVRIYRRALDAGEIEALYRQAPFAQ